MEQVGPEDAHRAGRDFEHDLLVRVDQDRVREELRRIVGIARCGPACVTPGQHPQRAVARGGVVEEQHHRRGVGRVLGCEHVPVRIVLVPRERRSFPRSLEVQLRRERREVVDAEHIACGVGEAGLVVQRVEAGVEVRARFDHPYFLRTVAPFPLDDRVAGELQPAAVGHRRLGSALGPACVRDDPRDHGFAAVA